MSDLLSSFALVLLIWVALGVLTALFVGAFIRRGRQ